MFFFILFFFVFLLLLGFFCNNFISFFYFFFFIFLKKNLGLHDFFKNVFLLLSLFISIFLLFSAHFRRFSGLLYTLQICCFKATLFLKQYKKDMIGFLFFSMLIDFYLNHRVTWDSEKINKYYFFFFKPLEEVSK